MPAPFQTDGRRVPRLTRRELAARLAPPVAVAHTRYRLTPKGLVEPTGLGVALARVRHGSQERWYPVAGERGVLMLPRPTLAALVAEGGA